jgi:hypothetical protein
MLRNDEAISIELPPLGSDAVVFYPIWDLEPNVHFVALGIAGRINGAGAVLNLQTKSTTTTTTTTNGNDKQHSVSIKVCGCGIFVMAVSLGHEVMRVRVNAVPTRATNHGVSNESYQNVQRLGYHVFSVELAPCTKYHNVVVEIGGEQDSF